MPGGALEALTATFEGPELLAGWQGALLLVGYGLLSPSSGRSWPSGATSSDGLPDLTRRTQDTP